MKNVQRFILTALLGLLVLGIFGCASKPQSPVTGTSDDQYWKKGGDTPQGAGQPAQKSPR
jgi:hypothetical protein